MLNQPGEFLSSFKLLIIAFPIAACGYSKLQSKAKHLGKNSKQHTPCFPSVFASNQQ